MRTRSSRRLPLLLAVALFAAFASPNGAEAKDKKSYLVTKLAFEPLIAAQEALQAGDAATARAALLALQKKEDKLNPHEKALLNQSLGYLEAGEGNYGKATGYLEVAIAQEALPDSQELQTLYNLAQLYVAGERYAEATRTLAKWFKRTEEPHASAYYLLAICFYQQERHDKALKPALIAIKRAKRPKEAWLQLALSLRLERKEYERALPLLEALAEGWPKKVYWMQLAAVYGELGKERQSLATLELAYTQGVLDRDEELRRIAQLYVYHEVPYRAAKVLEQGLADGISEPSAENYELLGNSWLRAREFDRAIEPLSLAAKQSDDGEIWLRLGQAYMQREEWSPAAEALRKALEQGGLDATGPVNLLLGVASFNQKNYDSARTYFARAAESEASRDDARTWLEHLNRAGGA